MSLHRDLYLMASETRKSENSRLIRDFHAVLEPGVPLMKWMTSEESRLVEDDDPLDEVSQSTEGIIEGCKGQALNSVLVDQDSYST